VSHEIYKEQKMVLGGCCVRDGRIDDVFSVTRTFVKKDLEVRALVEVRSGAWEPSKEQKSSDTSYNVSWQNRTHFLKSVNARSPEYFERRLFTRRWFCPRKTYAVV